MIDKKTLKSLNQLNKLCNGTYKVFEKSELQQTFNVSSETLENKLKFLKECEFIDVKYDDENVVCLTVLPKAIMQVDGDDNKSYSDKKLFLLIAISCVASVISSILSILIFIFKK